MSRFTVAVALVCIFACLAIPATTFSVAQEEWGDEREGAVKIPDQFGRTWLSGDMLVSRNGSLLLAQHEWIDAEWGDQLRAAFENPADGCLEFGRTSYGGGAWPETFVETVDRAGAIFHGVVTGIAGGFYGGMHPGLLIQVEVREWVKRNPGFPERPYFYFYYPVGDFLVGSIKVCKSDPDWPHPPGIGDEVLLFPQITPRGADQTFVRIDQGGVEVVTGNQAGIRITPALSEMEEFRAALSIQELKRLMEEALRELEGVVR